MTQKETIYKFLRETNNQAADKSLLLGLNRAEEPYRKILLDTVLKRGQPEAVSKIINQYHLLDQDWQQNVLQNQNHLDGGLRIASTTNDEQIRHSVISLIEQSNSFHLADIIVKLLQDSDQTIARRAGSTLISFSRTLAQNLKDNKLELGPNHTTPLHSQAMNNALYQAVQNYPQHQRMEAILAAMIVIAADDQEFWECLEVPHDPITQAVTRLLLTCDAIELAPFCVSALKHPKLKSKAARAIATHRKAAYIIEISQAVEEQNDPKINNSLKLVHHPKWFQRQSLPLAHMHQDDLQLLFNLVTQLGVEPKEIIDFLWKLAKHTPETITKQIIDYFNSLPEPDNLSALQKAIQSPNKFFAQNAQAEIIRLKPQYLNKILIQQLTSPHEEVRDLAAQACKGFAFEAYWKRFDRLDTKDRVAAGRAVFKIDPNAQQSWLEHFSDLSTDNRLKAIRISRLLNQTDIAKEHLIELAADDDRMVRSCAIAALGQMQDKQDLLSAQCLIQALNDQDKRVRANAVEAIEKRNLRQASEQIEALTKSNHNRLRANAIKAQLSWKVKTAQQTIRQMVSDSRPAHRRSAKWVVNEIENQNRKIKSQKAAKNKITKPFDIDQLEQIYAAVQ